MTQFELRTLTDQLNITDSVYSAVSDGDIDEVLREIARSYKIVEFDHDCNDLYESTDECPVCGCDL